MAEDEFTPEQLAEQIRQLRIQDILLSTVTTLGQLAYVKLEAKELDQAKLAIDAIAALLPTLEGTLDTLRGGTSTSSGERAPRVRERRLGKWLRATNSTATAPTARNRARASDSDADVPESSQESGSGTEPQSPTRRPRRRRRNALGPRRGLLLTALIAARI